MFIAYYFTVLWFFKQTRDTFRDKENGYPDKDLNHRKNVKIAISFILFLFFNKI